MFARDPHGDGRSLARHGLDLAGPAQGGSPFPHIGETNAAPFSFSATGVPEAKATPIILNSQNHEFTLDREAHLGGFGSRVFLHIGERLLYDAKEI